MNKQKTEGRVSIAPLDHAMTVWSGGLWKERFDVCAAVTVPQLQRMFESKEISHVLENFRICAGESEGDFAGTVFGDGDFYKWMEAAVCTATATGNGALLEQLEDYVRLIGAAQQPDGYLSTKQILGERSGNGPGRMGDINDFEVYNFGHMFTAACVYRQLTGKDSFLSIALKTAHYLEGLYQKAAEDQSVQTAVCPSHYMGLMDLYRTTGDSRWLQLAKLSVSLRDSVESGLDDNQDREKLIEHQKIIGHAVRANYLYAGVADLCAAEDRVDYRALLERMWRSLTEKKLYLTGGCGALYNGASPYGNFFSHQLVHQAYGYEYQLPNITAYNETCATVGGVLWAWRMFRLEQKASYFDTLERMMLNTNLAAVSLDGKRFFYENPLRRANQLDFQLVWPLTRSEYILSYCCPPNVARVIAQSASYAYAVEEGGVFIGLYGQSRAKLSLPCGTALTLVQTTDYPWSGTIHFGCEAVENDTPFTLHLRIPVWAEGGSITHNGVVHTLTTNDAGSYQSVTLEHPATDSVILELPMRARLTTAHNLVEETTNQAAVEYGPLVYCCETPDFAADSLDDLLLPPDVTFLPKPMELLGCKMLALEGEVLRLMRTDYDREALYQTLKTPKITKEKLRLIPYFAWDNRDATGEMRIWLPLAYPSI